MWRCCCTTSPRAGAAITACLERKWRWSFARVSGWTMPKPKRSPGWSAIICCCRTPRSGATSAIPRRSRISSAIVQSPERLRLLLILTVVDIRAVGPGTWNDWKRQLLRTLFDAAEERLRLGHKQRGRQEQVEARQQQLAGRTAVEGIGDSRPCPAASRQLLARRTAGVAACQCAAGGRRRGPYRRGGAIGGRSAGSRFRNDPDLRLLPRPARPLLSHRSRAQRSRRLDRRCANSHDARWDGARQSAGHRRPRESL